MLDCRTALGRGSVLILEGEGVFRTSYTIIEEIGRGGSCIVYSAWYEDLEGHRHIVRVKECCPYYLELKREEDGRLWVKPPFAQAFAEAQQKFREAYAKNVEIKHTLGLINSTADAMHLFSCHGTLYVVMDMVEGEDYRQDADENLQSLFIRMLALAKIIQKYHGIGFLHLDIKPENILLLPETRELIKLFDFDSLAEKEELRWGRKKKFSCSDGFSAPELVQGKQKKIGEATDIYSLGAMLFFKLFGRTPDAVDGALGKVYHFPSDLQEKFQDERYSPELFAALDVFLHKTVALSVICRYPNIDEVISALEELVRLSDIDGVFLFHHFSYHFSGFIGRERELARIGELFSQGQQVVFLSGIGGIGKTELARYYAFMNQQKYRKIVFLPFHTSIRETVCGNELRIHKIEQGEDEDNDAYFKRKLEILKTVVCPEDFIILDNFDVDCDDDLEELFAACPCPFLVTSREDFRDFGYEQLEVDYLEDMEELLGLFKTYYPRIEDKRSEEAVKAMIELIDRHTMTIALIAKYLRITDGDPGELLEKLMQKEGITSTEEIGIKHRKDRKLRAESVNRHLLALFDLSGFSAVQGELMRSLSLLGYVRISREMFFSFCPVEHAEELQVLIQRGWVEYDEEKDKLSLHQIILDLVYRYLAPAAENCPHIVRGMNVYICRTMANHAETMVRRQLVSGFMERMQGQNLDYAGLCVNYCQNIRKNRKYLDIAERICLEEGLDKGSSLGYEDRLDEERDEENQSRANDFLQKICRIKIEIAAFADDWFEQVEKEGDGFSEEGYLAQKAEEIMEQADRARYFAGICSSSLDYLGRFCVELGCELDEVVASSSVFMGIEEDNPSVDGILDMAVALFAEAEEFLLLAEMEKEEKIKLLKKIQGFFGENDFAAMYRSEHYADADQAWHYQKLINELRGTDDKVFHVSDIFLDDLAGIAEMQGDYTKALEIHQEMGVKGEEAISVHDNLYEIGRLYREMGEKEKAISCFVRVLEMEKGNEGEDGEGSVEDGEGSKWAEETNIGFFSYVSGQLIDLLISEQQTEKARKYSRELIGIHERKLFEVFEEGERYQGHEGGNAGADHLQWMTLGYYWLYKIEEDEEKKQGYWDCAVKYFAGISKQEEFSEDFPEFLLAFADKQENAEDKIKEAFAGMERVSTRCNWGTSGIFLDYILEICEKEIGEKEIEKREACEKNLDERGIGEEIVNFKRYQVMAFILYSECLMNGTSKDEARMLDYAVRARRIYEESGMEDEYLYSLIHKTLGRFYESRAFDGKEAEKVKRKCNYYLLAEHEAVGKKESEEIELWKEAAWDYHSLDNYKMEDLCYQRLFSVLTPEYCRKDYGRFDDYWYPSIEHIRCCQNLQEKDRVREKGWELCRKALEECLGSEDKESRGEAAEGKAWENAQEDGQGKMQEKERENADWFGKKLKECAELFLSAGWERDAFALYVLSLVSTVQGKISWAFWNRYSYSSDKESNSTEEENEEREELLSVVFGLIHGDIYSEDVDNILDVGEKLRKILGKNGGYKPFNEEWLWFKARYPHKDVEFKRKM